MVIDQRYASGTWMDVESIACYEASREVNDALTHADRGERSKGRVAPLRYREQRRPRAAPQRSRLAAGAWRRLSGYPRCGTVSVRGSSSAMNCDAGSSRCRHDATTVIVQLPRLTVQPEGCPAAPPRHRAAPRAGEAT